MKNYRLHFFPIPNLTGGVTGDALGTRCYLFVLLLLKPIEKRGEFSTLLLLAFASLGAL